MEPEKQQEEEIEFTHFLSVPLISKEFKNKMKNLQTEIRNSFPEEDRKKISFNNFHQFHITIAMLALKDETKREKALQIMKKYEKRIETLIDDPKFSIKLEKFDVFYMEKPDKTGAIKKKNIVFLDILDNENYRTIEKISDELTRELLKEEIVKESYFDKMFFAFMPERNAYRALKHHVTFYTSVAVDVDLSKVLEKYNNFEFGNVKCKGVDLSIRGEVDETGFYKSLHRIHFKKNRKTIEEKAVKKKINN